MLTVLDLFSGIGGFSLGLERTGKFKTIAFCEIEPYCRAILKNHWPNIPIYEDVRKLTKTNIGTTDVICGGFPCQDISIAGDKMGIEGKRSGLYAEMCRLICELRPKYAIMENVAALLNNGLGNILGSLAEIGYDAEWHCIPAAYVGAPHLRDRIWIVAYPHEMGRKICDFPISWGSLPRNRMVALASIQPTTIPPNLRMVDGVPDRMDANRIAACGNAILPQIPYIIGKAIIEAKENAQRQSRLFA